mmetsp:Transcript_105563/g.251557  ORF Transcript_105563/g.251557 Transcript_105563/m.251557 type:complete len:237 (+) Transcript_105563:376-1086(+)
MASMRGWSLSTREWITKLPYLVAAIVSRLKSPSPARKASAIKAWLLTSACSSMRWTTLLAVLWVACCRTCGNSRRKHSALRSSRPCSKMCCTTKLAKGCRANASRSSISSSSKKPICSSLQCSMSRSRMRLPNWCRATVGAWLRIASAMHTSREEGSTSMSLAKTWFPWGETYSSVAKCSKPAKRSRSATQAPAMAFCTTRDPNCVSASACTLHRTQDMTSDLLGSASRSTINRSQ